MLSVSLTPKVSPFQDFEIDTSAPRGQNVIWLGVNAGEWHQGDPFPTFFAKHNIQRTLEAGPDCEDVGGIRGGDGCCPAECGTCGGSGCGSRSNLFAIPGDNGSGSACCVGSIRRSGRMCDASAGVTAPCLSPDAFEWRTIGGGVRGAQVFVEGGDHTLEIVAGKAGTKIRDIRFTDRGSCGFTTTEPTDPAAIAAETAICQSRLTSLASFCPGGTQLPGLSVSLPSVCTSSCAGEFISLHASCRQLLEDDGVQGAALRTMDAFLDSCNSAPPSPPDVPPLSTEECTAQFEGLNSACCTPSKVCRSGVPSRCSASCVDPYLALYRDCRPTLEAIQNVDMALYDQLHGMPRAPSAFRVASR